MHMFRTFLTGLLGLIIVITADNAHAEQLSFKKSRQGDSQHFQYKWLDSNGNTQQIGFNLDSNKLAATPTEQQNYRPELAMRYVTVELLKVARQFDPRDANIKIRQQGDTVLTNVKARDKEKLNMIQGQLAQAKEAAYDDYLDKHYFTRYRSFFNEEAIKPDHIRYMSEMTDALIPLSQAFYEKVNTQADAREYFNLLLSWVQSIPYDALDNRAQSNGSGFAPPAQLLNENRGDCDSKSVLIASIARAFLPDTAMVLVLLPEHALLGIALTPKKGEETLVEDGKTYVLMEPTGPALFTFGEIAESSAKDIAKGMYTLEQIQ